MSSSYTMLKRVKRGDGQIGCSFGGARYPNSWPAVAGHPQ